MDRRKFLAMGAAVVGGIALEQAIPLGRVWSKEIRLQIHDLLVDTGISESDKLALVEIVRKYREGWPVHAAWTRHLRVRHGVTGYYGIPGLDA